MVRYQLAELSGSQGVESQAVQQREHVPRKSQIFWVGVEGKGVSRSLMACPTAELLSIPDARVSRLAEHTQCMLSRC